MDTKNDTACCATCQHYEHGCCWLLADEEDVEDLVDLAYSQRPVRPEDYCGRYEEESVE